MKYYLIAGEASGDLHGANLIKALKEQDPAAEIKGWGGDQMAAAGMPLTKHIKDLAFMGFVEVVKNLRTILGNFKVAKQDILNFQPNTLVLIDYPGFNLRLAKWAHQQGLKVIYYISPQLWAWHKSRVHQIKKYVDHLFVILPFEVDFYAQYDYLVTYVGHPLLDVIDGYESNALDLPKDSIAMLPGSRKQEIECVLPVLLETAKKFPDEQFILAGAPAIDPGFYQPFLSNGPQNVQLIQSKTYDLLAVAKAAIVTSGTATLETALFQVPEVVVYKGSPLSYAIAKRLVDIKYISLVNLIMDQEIVTELIQHDLTVERLQQEVERILDPTHQQQLTNHYRQLREKLGGSGASQRVAEGIVSLVNN